MVQRLLNQVPINNINPCSRAWTDSTCELNILARKLRDENAPPLSLDLTDMDGLAQVEKEMGEESSDGDEDAAGVDERE